MVHHQIAVLPALEQNKLHIIPCNLIPVRIDTGTVKTDKIILVPLNDHHRRVFRTVDPARRSQIHPIPEGHAQGQPYKRLLHIDKRTKKALSYVRHLLQAVIISGKACNSDNIMVIVQDRRCRISTPAMPIETDRKPAKHRILLHVGQRVVQIDHRLHKSDAAVAGRNAAPGVVIGKHHKPIVYKIFRLADIPLRVLSKSMGYHHQTLCSIIHSIDIACQCLISGGKRHRLPLKILIICPSHVLGILFLFTAVKILFHIMIDQSKRDNNKNHNSTYNHYHHNL